MAMNAIDFSKQGKTENVTPITNLNANSNENNDIEKEVIKAITEDREVLINLENDRHKEALAKIDKHFETLVNLEKKRREAIDEATKLAKKDLDEIRNSIKDRLNETQNEVDGITDKFKEQKNKALQALREME